MNESEMLCATSKISLFSGFLRIFSTKNLLDRVEEVCAEKEEVCTHEETTTRRGVYMC